VKKSPTAVGLRAKSAARNIETIQVSGAWDRRRHAGNKLQKTGKFKG